MQGGAKKVSSAAEKRNRNHLALGSSFHNPREKEEKKAI